MKSSAEYRGVPSRVDQLSQNSIALADIGLTVFTRIIPAVQ